MTNCGIYAKGGVYILNMAYVYKRMQERNGICQNVSYVKKMTDSSTIMAYVYKRMQETLVIKMPHDCTYKNSRHENYKARHY